MYAVIVTGSKQQRVSVGEKLRIDLMQGKNKGDAVVFDQVLMLGGEKIQIGKPTIAGALVKATVLDNGIEGEGVKAKKIHVFKKKRRKGYHKMQGHRQRHTEVLIESIEA